MDHLPIIKKDTITGFSNGGWALDRYTELERLDSKACITVADLKGPGLITHFHTTRHYKPEVSTRGIVLLIYFDNETEPAVQCPLGDFFGDGCNGKSMDFSTPLIECAPGSYNVYIPMPFKTSAKVMLRNDTDIRLDNYSYVEWEPLDAWNPDMGYFHATYQRKAFQLSDKSHETFFHVNGAGHLLGRQFSVATDEPMFEHFNFVMEGNNEVDIDGRERQLDYLGSEDSFTFSWGFQRRFAGYRAGMPFLKTDEPLYLLSMYRFHDHMPIRFKKELNWSINWKYEYKGSEQWRKDLDQRVKDGGGWVDYATVYYWYQDNPAGYHHQPLAPVPERIKDLLKSSRSPAPDNTQEK
ncbi:MAG: DUF2961 domain-containing protein [Sedimentisphaerales bacterium]|nr:DUF2961 domain-containing protein [Sedimentisphaerales bacterium]